MPSHATLRRLTLLLAVSSIALTGFAQSGRTTGGRKPATTQREKDNPTLRREAMRQWYGGDWSPEYRRFVMEAAAREAERWGAILPGGREDQAAVAGTRWRSLGPTRADRQWNGADYDGLDSGRPRSLVVDPQDGNIIYNATSGGGIWKTTNGGTTWTCITDGLGSQSSGFLAMDPTNRFTLYYGLGDAFDGTGTGVFKTTDGGATWTTLSFGLGAATVINGIGVGSSNNQMVLVATNAGLYRSMNGGASFAKVAIATGKAVDPTCWSLARAGGQNWVLAMESDAGDNTGNGTAEIWYSSNDGETWTKATGLASPTYRSKGKDVPVGITRTTLAAAPSQPATLYAYTAVFENWGGVDNNGNYNYPELDMAAMWRSTDAGHTWASMGTTAGFNAGSFSTNYTNANADSTEPGAMLGGQAWYNQMLVVDPVTPTTLYAGGNLALVKITNAIAGPVYTVQSNWLADFAQPYIHADFHTATFGPGPDYTLYMGTDGGVFKRTDAAANTWTYNPNIGLVSHLCYSVGSTLGNGTQTARDMVITGMQDNGTRVRKNGTSTFDQTNGGDGFGVAVHPLDHTKQLSSLYYARVYRSNDSGQTWAQTTAADSGVFTTRVVPGLADVNGDTVYSFGTNAMRKSTNFGNSWSNLGTTGLPAANSYAIRNIGAAKSNGSVLGMVLSGGRAYISTNGGTSWTQTSALTNNGLSISYISFRPTDATQGYIASVAADSTKTHLWKFSNSGATITAFDTGAGFPAGIPVNAVVEDPGEPGTIYAATHLGVYRTTDNGATWARFGTGLPLVNVTDFWIAPDSSFMRVSTFGRGIWELDTNGGQVSFNTVTPADSTVNSGQVVAFAANATDNSGGTLTYTWNFGDNATGTGATASHPYVNYGATPLVYPATVTAYSSNKDYALATRNITVATSTPATSVSISQSPANPTAGQPVTFTANGAGSNAVGIGYQYQWWVWDASRGGHSGGGWVMMQDYGGSNTFTQVLPAGTYGVGVDVRTRTAVSFDTFTAINSYTVAPLFGGTAPAEFDALESFKAFHAQREREQKEAARGKRVLELAD